MDQQEIRYRITGYIHCHRDDHVVRVPRLGGARIDAGLNLPHLKLPTALLLIPSIDLVDQI